ncbi:hypothetical protein AALD22_26560 [Lachnospiraceae bacterium 56-18]
MKNMIKCLKVFIELIKLETMSVAGRVNLGAIVILIVFVLAYTTNDLLCYTVSAVRDAVKTWILKTNISDPYQTVSIFKLIIPVIVLVIFCLLFLYINERAKKKINQAKKNRGKKRAI